MRVERQEIAAQAGLGAGFEESAFGAACKVAGSVAFAAGQLAGVERVDRIAEEVTVAVSTVAARVVGLIAQVVVEGQEQIAERKLAQKTGPRDQ